MAEDRHPDDGTEELVRDAAAQDAAAAAAEEEELAARLAAAEAAAAAYDRADALPAGRPDYGRARIADTLEELSDRIETHAHEAARRGGVQAQAGRIAARAGHVLDDGADYIRSHDLVDMRVDLEEKIRARPLLSIGLAAGIGFVLARMLRD